MDESPDSRKGYVRKAGTELEPLPRALTKEETENLVEYVRKAWGYVWRNDQWELEVASPDIWANDDDDDDDDDFSPYTGR
ncbi:unnamed protein product [Penicillium manginii]